MLGDQRRGVRAGHRLFRGPPEPPEASSAADPRAAAFCERATPSHHRCRSHRSAVHERRRLRRTLASAVASEGAAGARIEKSSAQWVRLNCGRCEVIRSFTMKSECRSSALAAASLSALGLYHRKITHTSTSIWAMRVGSSAPIAPRYSISIRVWAHMKLIRRIVLTVTWTELKKQQSRFSRRYNGHSPDLLQRWRSQCVSIDATTSGISARWHGGDCRGRSSTTSTARRTMRSRIGEIPKPTSGAIWCPTFSRASKALTCR